MALIDFANQRVKVVVSLFGQHKEIVGKLLSYKKPFLELEICGIIRIFNENAIKEVIPLSQVT